MKTVSKKHCKMTVITAIRKDNIKKDKENDMQAQNGGRLREHDREAIADKLIEWAKGDDSLNLCAFCSKIEIAPSKLSQWAKEDERFRQALDLAKCFIAVRRENKASTGELHLKAYDLNVAVYDYFLKEERRSQLEFECDLKKQLLEFGDKLKNEVLESVSPELAAQFNNLMSQITTLQNNLKIHAL